MCTEVAELFCILAVLDPGLMLVMFMAVFVIGVVVLVLGRALGLSSLVASPDSK